MSAIRYTQANVASLKDKNIFCDTNILIFLYFSTRSRWEECTYGNIFNQLILNNNKFIIDNNVLSEVINRSLKTTYQEYLTSTGSTCDTCNYKQWRNSPAGQASIETTYTIIRSSILKTFIIDDKAYTNTDITTMLTPSKLDWTDTVIAKLCQEKGYILFTHDRDFATTNIDTLSANPNLS